METFHPQYVVDKNSTRTAVVLPMAEWERIVEELEDLDDIRAYDAAKVGSEESVPFEQAVREIDESQNS